MKMLVWFIHIHALLAVWFLDNGSRSLIMWQV